MRNPHFEKVMDEHCISANVDRSFEIYSSRYPFVSNYSQTFFAYLYFCHRFHAYCYHSILQSSCKRFSLALYLQKIISQRNAVPLWSKFQHQPLRRTDDDDVTVLSHSLVAKPFQLRSFFILLFPPCSNCGMHLRSVMQLTLNAYHSPLFFLSKSMPVHSFSTFFRTCLRICSKSQPPPYQFPPT